MNVFKTYEDDKPRSKLNEYAENCLRAKCNHNVVAATLCWRSLELLAPWLDVTMTQYWTSHCVLGSILRVKELFVRVIGNNVSGYDFA